MASLPPVNLKDPFDPRVQDGTWQNTVAPGTPSTRWTVSAWTPKQAKAEYTLPDTATQADAQTYLKKLRANGDDAGRKYTYYVLLRMDYTLSFVQKSIEVN
jgi:hypothetical protein